MVRPFIEKGPTVPATWSDHHRGGSDRPARSRPFGFCESSLRGEVGEGRIPVIPVNPSIPDAVARALGVQPAVLDIRERILHELPTIECDLPEKLGQLALALSPANTLFRVATRASDPVPSLSEEGMKLRALLFSDAEALAKRGLVDEHALRSYKGSVGYRNLAFDLQILVAAVPQLPGIRARSLRPSTRGPPARRKTGSGHPDRPAEKKEAGQDDGGRRRRRATGPSRCSGVNTISCAVRSRSSAGKRETPMLAPPSAPSMERRRIELQRTRRDLKPRRAPHPPVNASQGIARDHRARRAAASTDSGTGSRDVTNRGTDAIRCADSDRVPGTSKAMVSPHSPRVERSRKP